MRVMGTLVASLSGLATTALAVRSLGLADYGVLAVALSGVSLALGIGTLGVMQGVTQVVAGGIDPKQSHTLLDKALSLAIYTALLGTAWVTMTVITVADSTGEAMVMGGGMGLLLLGSGIGRVATGVSRGLGRPILMEVPISALTIGKLIALAAVASSGVLSPATVAIAFGVVGLSSGALSLHILMSYTHYKPSLTAILQIRGNTVQTFFPFALLTFTTILTTRSGIIALGIVADPATAGAYEAVLRLIEQIMIAASLLLAPVFLAVATRALGSGDQATVRWMYALTTKVAILVSVPGLVLLVVFRSQLFTSLFGAAFPDDSMVVNLLTLAFFLNAAIGLNITTLMALGDTRLLLRTGYAACVLSLAITVPLTVLFDEIGAAIAVLTSIALRNVYVGLLVWKRTAVHPLTPDVALTFAACVGTIAATSLWIDPSTGTDLYRHIAFSLLVGVAASIITLLLRGIHLGELKKLSPWEKTLR